MVVMWKDTAAVIGRDPQAEDIQFILTVRAMAQDFKKPGAKS
ncbi:hypothetical protein Pan1_85 [Pseudanabaena phage Pan1]|nr:hypothetical protein Pan1_85 [Pseudanabaena phage Pan1]